MAAARPTNKRNAPENTSAAAPTSMPLWAKWLLSLFAIWHVAVVFLAPFSVPPSSQLATDVAQSAWVRWYTDPLYLNHGYHFFGPNPPVNQRVRYVVLADEGQTLAEGEFPNKSQQRPRLLYHRHMMLADQAGLGLEAYDDAVRLSLRSYARHLLRLHEGAETRLDLVRHLVLFPQQSLDGQDPNDPSLFEEVMSVREFAEDLETPLVIPVEQELPRREG